MIQSYSLDNLRTLEHAGSRIVDLALSRSRRDPEVQALEQQVERLRAEAKDFLVVLKERLQAEGPDVL